MMNKILVPYDGSKHSKRALEAAVSLCKGRKAESKLTVIFIANLYQGLGYEYGAPLIDPEDRLREEGEILLKEAVQFLEQDGIKCESVLDVGDPAQQIDAASKEGKYDLIVMGSRGLGSFGGMLLGSVSHKIVHTAQCPVMIVK